MENHISRFTELLFKYWEHKNVLKYYIVIG